MTASDDNIFQVLSDFMKGKSVPKGINMAKLSWEGAEPPELTKQPELSNVISEFAAEYPIVVSGLARCKRSSCLALIGGMLTLPELQSNCFRLTILAHLAAYFSKGKTSPTPGQISAWYNQLDKGSCGRIEDAAEDVFLANVYYRKANFRLFEGTVEGNAFHTQLLLNTLDEMPDDGVYASLKSSVEALLQLSEVIAFRAELPRNIVGNPIPRSEIGKPMGNVLRNIMQWVTFSETELQSLGVSRIALTPFIVSQSEMSIIDECVPGHSPLNFMPIIRDGKQLIVTMPSEVGTAIRGLIIEKCQEFSALNNLKRSLANAYKRLFADEAILGELRNPPVRMTDYGDFCASQMSIEVDRGRYVHLIFIVDGFDGYENGAFLGVNKIEAVSRFVEKSLDETVEAVSSKPGFRKGVSLVVSCSWGRMFALDIGRGHENWSIESISAYDLITLGRHSDFELLDLFRIFDGQEALQQMGINLVNQNGFLNLYGWINSKGGHLVPHNQLESDFVGEHSAFLQIPPNSMLDIRHEVANAVDIHIAERPDGSAILVRRVNSTPRFGTKALSPFYVDTDAIKSLIFRAVYEGKQHNYWVESYVNDSLGLDLRYHLSNMVNNWSEVVFRHLDELGLSASVRSISCVFIFLDESRPSLTEPIPDNEAISKLIEVRCDKANSRVEFLVGEGFLASGRRVDNVAEKGVVFALLHACTDCFELNLSEEDIKAISNEIIGDIGARHFHAFAANDVRDYVRDSLPKHAQVIERMDDANCRLGLGWLSRDRKEGGDINGKKACCEYLNSLVRSTAYQLMNKISKFDRAALIEMMLINHEAAFVEAKVWERTFRSVRALSDDHALTVDEATKKLGKLNAASMSSRIIVEIALCESPFSGGDIPGKLDVGRLLADASQIFHLGGYSDAMNAEIMTPTIKISPAGDVLMEQEFTDKIVQPFGKEFQSTLLDSAAANYEENYRGFDEEVMGAEEPVPNSDENFAFESAWQDEFGITIQQTRVFVDAFHDLAVEHEKAVLYIPRYELLSYLSSHTKLQPEDLNRLLELFSLVHRQKWDRASEGFSDQAWHPWRFRRRLSLISKPIIQLEDHLESMCIIAPAMIVHHIEKFVSDVRFGRFDESAFRVKGASGPITSWIGEVNRLQGEEFNLEVRDRFISSGWQAKANLSDGAMLNRSSDTAFGDVDVLAWSPTLRRVVVAECKDLSLDKTMGEIARRLARYRGLTDERGRRDDLRKHLDRCDVLRNEKQRLSNFVGFEIDGVESVLIFSHATPMHFYNLAAEHGVEMLTISDISKWVAKTSCPL